MSSFTRRLAPLAFVAAVALGIPTESQAQMRRGGFNSFGGFGFNFPMVNPGFVQQSQARFLQANPVGGMALQQSINLSNAAWLANYYPWGGYGYGGYGGYGGSYDPYGGYVAS